MKLKITPGVSFRIPNLADLEMIWIPAGEFFMGSPEEESGRRISETLHKVTLTKPYWLGKFPVTLEQWDIIARYSRYKFDCSNTSGMSLYQQLFSNAAAVADKNVPVVKIDWRSAMAFCNNLNERYKLPEGYAFSLPTEAQWEYACRAGTTGAYAGNLESMAWFDGNSNGSPHAVGQKMPNAWGLHDMYGNVREWCHDTAGPYNKEDAEDPLGASAPPKIVEGEYCICRGGGFDSPREKCRSASRSYVNACDNFCDIGFRLALSYSGSETD